MSEYVQKDGEGSLFVNEKTKDTQPDRSGYFIWEGKRMKIAGCVAKYKDGKQITDSKGNPILNLRVSVEEVKSSPLDNYGDESMRTKHLDDEIPF